MFDDILRSKDMGGGANTLWVSSTSPREGHPHPVR